MSRLSLPRAAAGLLCLGLACTRPSVDPPPPSEGQDAATVESPDSGGVVPDAGRSDAAVSDAAMADAALPDAALSDGGTPMDAGNQTDASGAPADASIPADASGVLDAAAPGDASTPADAAAPDSGNNPMDAGVCASTCPAQQECGTADDGCGGSIACGTCTGFNTCGGGGTAGRCGCTPATQCPAGQDCGSAADGCGGTLDCGMCSAPQTCGGGGSAGQCGCAPATQCPVGQECGSVQDGCGGSLPCGTCDPTEVCSGTVCTPTLICQTSCPMGQDCGTAPDGCGNMLDCGTCTAPNTCGGGGNAGQCGCIPALVCPPGQNCGVAPDGCGGMLDCGMCVTPQTCGGAAVANQCGCTPATTCPAGQECGSAGDGCGGLLTCGTCAAPQTCGGGGVPGMCGCTPLTVCPGGQDCGSAQDGCGGTLTCGTCTLPMSCGGAGTPGVCGCTPSGTCSPGQSCGTAPDGCGGTITCGTCDPGETCTPALRCEQTTFAMFDVEGHLLGEYDADGNAVYEVAWLGNVPIARLGALDIQSIQTDHLGTPRSLQNAQGATVWLWDGEAFGASPANDDPDGDGTPVVFNMRFPGQLHDAESGLHHNWFRDYDPSLGRYLQADPLGLRGGLNGYSYAAGSPVQFVDANGLCAVRLTESACKSLRDLVAYEQAHGKIQTMRRYDPLNRSGLTADLNTNYPSILGCVDADWMFRVVSFGPLAVGAYFGGKFTWNAVRSGGSVWQAYKGETPTYNVSLFENFFEEGNIKAPVAANLWLARTDLTLADLFRPALDQCASKCTK